VSARPLGSLAVALWVALAAGCAGLPLGGEPAPLRISEVAGAGDAARRASTRLVLDGLADDADGQLDAAQAAYERALRVDPTNPWAYLALARHYAEGIEPAGAMAYLERTEALLDAEGGVPPRADAHLVGLRGAALSASGRGDEGSELLAEARRRAPSVWDDGRLAADELR
jgi:tetratricopeptide (TPR) repeat protein